MPVHMRLRGNRPTSKGVLPGNPRLHWVIPSDVDGQSRWFSLPSALSLSQRSLVGADRHNIATLVDSFLTGLPQIRALPADGDGAEPTILRRLRQWWTGNRLREPEVKLRDRVTELLGPADIERVKRLITADYRTSVLGSANCSELFPTVDGREVHALIDEVCVGPADWEIGVLLGEQIEILTQISPKVHPAEDPVVITLLAHSATPRSHLGLIAGLRWLLHLHDYLTYVSYSGILLEKAISACALITNPFEPKAVAASSTVATSAIPD